MGSGSSSSSSSRDELWIKIIRGKAGDEASGGPSFASKDFLASLGMLAAHGPSQASCCASACPPLLCYWHAPLHGQCPLRRFLPFLDLPPSSWFSLPQPSGLHSLLASNATGRELIFFLGCECMAAHGQGSLEAMFRSLEFFKRFIIVEANGGLNQQRSSICNAVAVAGFLNATLVIPHFHLNSVWKDRSSFADIYNEEHFIKSLAYHVRVVRQIPDYIMQKFQYNITLIHNFKVKAWAPATFYEESVLPKLLEAGVIRISPFANRLSYSEVPSMIQQLRCFANFESLRFAESVEAVGEKLVTRMKERSVKYDGKYVAVHLRFEEDMVAFSCCIYDGGKEEQRELDAARERGWKGKFRRPGRVIRPGANRMNGKCPMTPLEVGLMLRGMGFQNDTPIFVASGKIYNVNKNMAPLHQMFPFLYSKETLLSEEELKPFKEFSSRLAALDYTVCLKSEVFVTTQGGNFPQFLIGHRRYLHNGHAKTIKPDKRKLAVLLDTPDSSWETFKKELQVMRYHSDLKGYELRKVSASIYTYPAPECLCSQSGALPESTFYQ